MPDGGRHCHACLPNFLDFLRPYALLLAVNKVMSNTVKISHISAAVAAFLILAFNPASSSAGEGGYRVASNAHDLMAQAVQAMNAKDYDEAVRIMERANQADPFDESVKSMLAQAYKARGWALYSKEDFDDGMVDFKRANSYESKKNHDTYLALGYGSFRLKNYDDALYYLYDAVYINPDDTDSHEMIGSIYYQRGKLGEAIDEWEAALRIRPDNQDLERMLAKAKKEFKVEGKFDRTETYYFNIKYEGGERGDLGDMVLDILDRAYRDVGSDLDYFPNEPVTVILYTQKQFSDITDAPAWSGGVFDGSIRIPVGGEVNETALSIVLYHEYAHAVVAMVAGRGVPTWLNEGIAQYEQHWVQERPVTMSRADAVPISSLDGPFVSISDPEKAGAAYLESLSVVSYFVQQFGKYNLARFVKLVGGGKTVPDAVRECTGISYGDFERYWLSSLSG